MGVELLKIPAKLAPSGNPMNFKVRAGNYAISGHRLTAQIQIETVPDISVFPFPDYQRCSKLFPFHHFKKTTLFQFK